MSGHLPAFEDFTRVLAHTDRTRGSMSSTHTVRSVLHVEVPTLNRALHSFTFADGLGVDVLADLKMARP